MMRSMQCLPVRGYSHSSTIFRAPVCVGREGRERGGKEGYREGRDGDGERRWREEMERGEGERGRREEYVRRYLENGLSDTQKDTRSYHKSVSQNTLF